MHERIRLLICQNPITLKQLQPADSSAGPPNWWKRTHSPAQDGTKTHLGSSSRRGFCCWNNLCPSAVRSQGPSGSATPGRCQSCTHPLPTAVSCTQGERRDPRVLLSAPHHHWHKDSSPHVWHRRSFIIDTLSQVCLVLRSPCSLHGSFMRPYRSLWKGTIPQTLFTKWETGERAPPKPPHSRDNPSNTEPTKTTTGIYSFL